MKARTYLILMAVAILVPVACIMAAGLDMLLRWERESRLRSVEEAGRSTALLVDREIAAAESALRGLANSTALREGRLADLHRDASGMNRSTPWMWTTLMDYDGTPLMNTLVPWGTALPAYHARWVGNVYDAQRSRVSGYFVGLLAKKATVSVDVPVPAGIGRRYVVSQIIDAGHFMEVFGSGAISPNWLVTIFGADGISIARNRNAKTMVGKPVAPELFQASRTKPSGLLRHTTKDGVDVYSLYTRAPLSQWTVAVGVPVSEIEATARKATVYAAVALVALLGIAIGIAVLLARRMKASLEQAQLAAEGLLRGQLPAPQPTHVDEVDMLLDGLQRTSADLARERHARHALEEEREALLRGEQEARREAERRSQAKDAFLAMLGHELRNPLAAISGALAVLDLPGVKAEQAAQARVIGNRQARHLKRIVDDLLDVRRILSGKVTLQRARIDAGALLRRCAEAKMLADAGEHAWSVEVAELWVEADATRLEQVFDNLLHNAIKYTPSRGLIALRGRSIDGSAVVELTDTGVGIAPDTLPFIFEALVQGPISIDRAQGGLGLGLALVKELTQLHGGTVRAHSEGAGQGCTFTVTLPLAAEAAEALAEPG